MTEAPPESRYGTAASRWAGVGPYYAMFPVRFATAVVREHTKPGDCVFDPFAGRATSLFAAASEGRIGLGIEINPVGWVYGKAKLQTAKKEDVEEQIRWLGTKAHSYQRKSKKLPTRLVDQSRLLKSRIQGSAPTQIRWQRDGLKAVTAQNRGRLSYTKKMRSSAARGSPKDASLLPSAETAVLPSQVAVSRLGFRYAPRP